MLYQKAMEVATQNKRKTIRVDDLYAAIQKDFKKYEFLNEAFGSPILLKVSESTAEKEDNKVAKRGPKGNKGTKKE